MGFLGLSAHVEFECRKCGTIVSLEQYESDRFCPKCGTFLQAKRLRIDRVKAEKRDERIEISREDINVNSLFYEYTHYSPIDAGGGVVFKTVDSWIFARKQAYQEFRKKFSPAKVYDIEQISKDFKEWLLFRNNLSWTTLQRTGYQALKKPERLANLLFLLQNDELDVAERIRRGLKGKEKVRGIGQGILTALLHTFYDDKYCVWNSRTQETLEILRRPPKTRSDIGKTYKEVNKELHALAEELNTDLTTIDGFMWFISKHVRFI
jgi:DNA-directed RNA polymerase subunit RPC12/RpoP